MACRCRYGAVGDCPARRHGAFRRTGGGCLCPAPFAEWSRRPGTYRTEISSITTALTHEICSPVLPQPFPLRWRERVGEAATPELATYACPRNIGPLHLQRVCSGDSPSS